MRGQVGPEAIEDLELKIARSSDLELVPTDIIPATDLTQINEHNSTIKYGKAGGDNLESDDRRIL